MIGFCSQSRERFLGQYSSCPKKAKCIISTDVWLINVCITCLLPLRSQGLSSVKSPRSFCVLELTLLGPWKPIVRFLTFCLSYSASRRSNKGVISKTSEDDRRLCGKQVACIHSENAPRVTREYTYECIHPNCENPHYNECFNHTQLAKFVHPSSPSSCISVKVRVCAWG